MSANAPYTTAAVESKVEIVISRSRFIGRCFPVESEEDALRRLATVKKEHYDATHNCYAYRAPGGIARFSDDGEPQGTAGRPILDVLTARDVTNALIVVTRYFGGVKLGAGGLTRAYAKCAAAALDAAGEKRFEPSLKFTISVPYPMLSVIENWAKAAGFLILGREFGDDVSLAMLTRTIDRDRFLKEISALSKGGIIPREGWIIYHAWDQVGLS